MPLRDTLSKILPKQHGSGRKTFENDIRSDRFLDVFKYVLARKWNDFLG